MMVDNTALTSWDQAVLNGMVKDEEWDDLSSRERYERIAKHFIAVGIERAKLAATTETKRGTDAVRAD